MIIQGDMANLPPDTTKYLTIVRTDSFDDGIPFYLRTKYAIHWARTSNENQLKQDLLKELYDIDSEPPLGKRPVFLIIKRVTQQAYGVP